MADLELAEEWRPVKGFEGYYEVSNLGRVRSVAREVAFGSKRRTAPSKVLGGGVKPGGYLFVMLSKPSEGQTSAHRHRLVAEAFIGDRPFDAAEVNHIDGDKTNNTLPNLEWVSHSENIRHSYRIGLRARGAKHLAKRGEAHPNSKLSERQLSDIRRALNEGATGASLAILYGISRSHISRIKNGVCRRYG